MRGRLLGRWSTGAGYAVAWLLLAGLLALLLFTTGSRATNLASHDAVVQPRLDGRVVVRTGPVLPDLRLPAGGPIGADVVLGKTDAESVAELFQRYAVLAGSPQGQVDRLRDAVTQLAWDSALRGGALAVLPVLGWALLGRARRRELVRAVPSRRGLVVAAVLGLVAAVVAQPFRTDGTEAGTVAGDAGWQSLEDFLGPAVVLPAQARSFEVRGDVTTSQTRRLIESALDTYDRSNAFYDAAALAAGDLELRAPGPEDTVVTLVSDRHDNIGMDRVARAIGDAAGATAVFDAGDDTSTGRSWEAFSLDSLDAVFGDLDGRWAVTGNHDNGTFVGSYLADLGWTVLNGEPVDGPGGVRLLGVGDPRSSGLGSWRDETGLSFAEVESRVADAACAADDDGKRISTVLVHDTNLGREALSRGCTDLVVGGHVHVRSGPTPVVGEAGSGTTYTTGTTGGAAYAVALGSKPRRAAEVSLLTYRDGVPVGVQSVLLQTDGTFEVRGYAELPAAAAPTS